ncbi:type III secretion system protein [Salmonella enterica subsp. enterica serovar Newport]|uniref:Type III secretion system protein n=1 Tax=Salmonella enterica TaxID=28901 RepID=A0A744U2P1_SALER|nr:type III secretion system inner rod subunit SctI [Salmonella enterica]EAB7892617.1 type III secretion system protein [Salmonella enterica subsp. enterica serovar Newport]EBW5413656.1 type III secretion system protein [Salmonella enterica subsp. enterica serovar Bonn]EBS1785824.1 type III secretion system protein [Salmonella enterica subsp. enterica serovar Newport]EBS2853497.1 type III secretion system protein [Salmonella enterica subsp. enterica serovar Newport]EBS6823750.1 type III secret
MILQPDLLTNLTKLTLDKCESGDTVSVYENNYSDIVSGLFNKVSETDLYFKNSINSLNSVQLTSNPQYLLLLQKYLGEYSNYVSLVSTLARKGVSTIETLEKS